MEMSDDDFQQWMVISMTYRGNKGRTQSVVDVPDCLQDAWWME